MTHEQEEARELAKAMVDEMIALHDYAGRPAWDAIAERYLSEALRQRDEARAALVYKGDYDTDDEHTEAILAAHPIKSGDWKQWSQALEMVSNRKSKGSLVMLVNWMLRGRNDATAQRDKAVEALRPFADLHYVDLKHRIPFSIPDDKSLARPTIGQLEQAAAVVREIKGK